MGLLDELMINDQDKQGALNQGLLSAGLGILANNTSRNPMQAIGRGGMQGMESYQQALQQAQAQKLQKMQMMEYAQKRDALMKIRERLPAEMQPMFDADPGAFLAQINKPREVFDKVNPKDYTPESVAKFSTSQNYADLVPYADPNKMSKADELKQRHLDRIAEIEAAGRISAGNRPAPVDKVPMGYRMKPDGSMEAIPGGPSDAKAQAQAQRIADGATDVDVALAGLRDAYGRLEQGGGITSTANNPLSNAMAWASSSGPGQAAGKMFGTQNQSARNDIAMQRPALLAALMKATGMSAKQMDSNAELKLWLSTATDPTLDVEANKRALDNIERKYLKKGMDSSAPDASASKVRKYNPATGRIE